MNTTTLKVTGMSCMGCVRSVKALLEALPGVGQVEVDLASGRVDVSHDPNLASTDALRAAINDGGYSVQD